MSSISSKLADAREELLDLTLRNPLISYRVLKSRGAEVIDERPEEVYRILVEEGRKMSFLSVSDEQKEQLKEAGDGQEEFVFMQPDEDEETETADEGVAERHVDSRLQTPYTSSKLQGRLLNTFYYARRSIEEEGVNVLYLALGDLYWYRSKSGDTKRRAPLLLVPVEINRTSVQGRFRIEYTGEEIGGNISLQAYLKSEFGLELPMPPDPEEGELDIPAYFSEVSQRIQNQDRWYVDEHGLTLGFFSFTRFLMYEDLDPDTWPTDQKPHDHPVVGKLLGEGFPPPENQVADDVHLDQFLAPEDSYHVVEADSSQTRALLDVEEGLNLVLQGPPGTGKSQTITNVIAEAIGQEKSVLFVSEKMAALEVVKRKLDNVGLGAACLELHSHKTRKKTVLNELERTLNLGRPQVDDFSEEASVLMDAREELNAYAQAVNQPIGESGVRPYRAYGELLELREKLKGVPIPDMDIPEMKQWTGQTYQERRFLVEKVQSHLDQMGVPERHPFWGSGKDRFLPAHQEAIETAASEAHASLDELREAGRELAETLQVEEPEDTSEAEKLLRAARRFLEAPGLDGVAVSNDAWSTRNRQIEELVEAGQRFQELHDSYDDLLIPDAWDQEVVEMRQHLSAYGETWYRWLISDWRSAKNRLAGLCRTDLPTGADDRVAVVDGIMEVQRREETIEEISALGERLFGDRWRGSSSDWDWCRDVADYLTNLHSEIREGAVPEELLKTLQEHAPASEAVEEDLDRLESARRSHDEESCKFVKEIELDEQQRFGSSEQLTEQSFDVQSDLFNACEEQAPRIQEVVTYNQLERQLQEKGLGAVAEVLPGWPAGPIHLTDAFDRTFYNALLERAMNERPALDMFSGSQHEQVIERFRTLDEAALEHARHQLALKHHRGKPRKQGVGQVGTLLHEFGKKRRHMPIRKLMIRAGNAIQALKPVFMMSPMSIPKYLPPDSVDFDLVVFDEASQVRPVDALGSILRGDQTVVVGDSKQLPPTSFFDSMQERDDDDFEMHVGDQESILDLFRSKGAPERMLRFHYRSKHESLIAVSNKEFYENNLFVFPSPDAGRTETGLVYHHLPETIYDRGGSRKNKEEARIVAERVMAHARERPDMSLGVATFSSAQQEAVRDHLELMRREDPSCEDFFKAHPEEPFFVKNLESVQGDQRDVMYISVGYGRDGDGRVSMNFGPLNQEGGERRLNVLTTRAKCRCEVFTNLRADDIDLHRTNARGVEVLKEYLDFAETGELEMPTPSGRGPDSPFERAVARAIEERGYEVEHQIGTAGFYIDLAVVDPDRPGRYLLGIECDGATYHSSRTARDRDRIRQMVLEGQGWDIHRIWSTDWFRSPENQLAEVLTAIKAAETPGGTEPSESGEVSEEQSGSEDETRAAPTDGTTTIERAESSSESETPAQPYEQAFPRVVVNGSFHEIPNGRLGRWIQEVVETESPVYQEVVGRRLLEGAGISRMGRRIKKKIREAVRYAVQKGWIAKEGDVLLHPDQEEIPIRDRSHLDGITRDIDAIPSREIEAAITEIVSGSFGVGRDDLVQSVGRTLGFSRVGSKIQERISEIIDKMLEAGDLQKANGDITL